VTREATRPVAALLIALLAVIALASCGGSDDSGGTTSSSTAESTATVGGQGSSDGSGGKASGGDADGKSQSSNSDDSTRPVEAAPLRVSGGGSSQFHSKGGDNSIQDFGEEADEAALEEAATAVHDFYVARAEEDWSRACSYLSSDLIEQLDQLAKRSEKLGGAGCPAVLEALTAPLPEPARRESTVVDAASLRDDEGRAFLIYRGAGETTYAVLMAEEDGAWKVAGLAGTQLL